MSAADTRRAGGRGWSRTTVAGTRASRGPSRGMARIGRASPLAGRALVLARAAPWKFAVVAPCRTAWPQTPGCCGRRARSFPAARSRAAGSHPFRSPARRRDRLRPPCTRGSPTSPRAGRSCGSTDPASPHRSSRHGRRWPLSPSRPPNSRSRTPRRPSSHARRRRARAAGRTPSTPPSTDRAASAAPARAVRPPVRTSEEGACGRLPRSPRQ